MGAGGDFTGALDARQVRRLWAACKCAAGLRDVNEVDAGGGDPDQDLTRAWARTERRFRCGGAGRTAHSGVATLGMGGPGSRAWRHEFFRS